MYKQMIGMVAGLLACVSPMASMTAKAEPIAVLGKMGAGAAERNSDLEACRRIADQSPGRDLPATGGTTYPVGYAENAPQAIGGSIAFLIIDLFNQGAAERKGVRFCMENMGYAAIPLTASETAEYQPLTPAGREAWESRFLSGDITARAMAARPVIVPPLPPYRDEPAAIGGLRFHPESLVPASTPVGAGKVLLVGKVDRWRTAILKNDFATVSGPVTIAAKAGAVFHQVDYRPQRHPLMRVQGATWCGPVTQQSGAGPAAPSVYCLTSFPGGYLPFRPTGFDWLAGPQGDGFTLPLFTQAVVLEERADDELGPLDFQIELTKISTSSVWLTGYVVKGTRRVSVWSRQLKADQQGRMDIPLWTRTAHLSQSGPQDVAVTLSDGGDGKGLRDMD